MKVGTTVGVSGAFVIRKFARGGLQVPVRVDRNRRAFQRVWEHEQRNLITNAGLDRIGAAGRFDALLNYVALGTGSSAPDVTDTALDSELARTNDSLGLTSNEITSPSTGVQRYRRGVAFDFNEANGNLTEIAGFEASTGGSTLTRALLVDESDNPVTITKDNTEQLVVDYSLEIGYTPTTMTAQAPINVAGYGAFDLDLMFYRGYSALDASFNLISAFGQLRPVALSGTPGTTYDSSIGGWETWGTERGQERSSGSGVSGSGQAIEPYSGGSHKRVYTLELTAGSSDMTITGLGLYTYGALRWMACAWRFTDPATLVADKDYRLKLQAELSWARA